jgi:Lipoprotein LpqB beta-propeller domain/Sporulation and spore germination
VASRARAALAALAALAAALAVAGCVSVPSAGPVLSYPLAQQTSGQNGQNLQVMAAGPGNNWKPNAIVTGFLTAAAAIGDQQQVAREYLTPKAGKSWNPSWNAFVYKTGPIVQYPTYQSLPTKPQRGAKSTAKVGKQAPQLATVVVDGDISAKLSGHGTYAVPSSSAPVTPQVFQLVKMGGQWRISSAPSALLLTQGQFTDDYELRNLYFFDPNNQYLVPDPVYVPLQATTTSLMNRLVNDLITPPNDWLAAATQSAFPAGTKIVPGGVTLSGDTAAVNLGGAIATAPDQRTLLAQVSAQLLWTLIGPGQGDSQVTSVELLVNGQAKYPPGNSQGIAVQHLSEASYQPAIGATSKFYYLDSAGYLCSRDGVDGNQVQIAKIGTGYSQIAVSPDGKYLAALRDGSLWMGSVDGPLKKRQGSDYSTISWDPTDNLWTTTGGQVLTFRAGLTSGSAQAKPITAYVPPPGSGLITAIRIAPDGVRVALIVNTDELAFGAIVWQQGSGPGLAGAVRIELSPFNVSDLTGAGFTAVTWYGPDDVVTLSGTGSTLTEYPVNGGTPTSQLLDQSVDSITASSDQALIAGLAKGGMTQAPNLTGAWTPVSGKGISPTYPG